MQSSNEVVRQAGEFADGDDPDKAVDLCNQVLLNEPDHPGALFVLGCVLLKSQRHVPAMQMAKRICELCPKDPRGWQLLALVYGELHKYDDSIRCAEKALTCKRTDKVLADAAYAHVNAGNWDLADKYAKEAISAATFSPTPLARVAIQDATLSQGYARLAQGDWVNGWAGYRVTLRTKWRKEYNYGDSKEWMGEPDAVVMVTGEQGLGDEIMAASVIPDAAKACKTFIIDCDHRLAPLFARSFPNVIVSPTRRVQEVRLPVMPTHHKSLFGLSELFRKTDADFHRKPFLVPNQEYIDMFRALFNGQRVIGIAWSGGLPRTGQEQRKAGVAAFLPLIRRGEAEFVSLEYKDDAAEVREFEKAHGVKVRRLPWVTQGQDMDLLAGLIASMSEVVSVGTAVAHIASALGVPTTILVNPGLGWAFARPEMMWYPPSTQMFRKQRGESWRECVTRFTESRKEKLAA